MGRAWESIRRLPWPLLAGALLVLVLARAAARSGQDSLPGGSTPSLRAVRVAPVSEIEAVEELRLPGTTRAARRATLSFVVGGRLVERSVDLGDRVAQGAVLARLDPGPFQNEVEAADAALAEVSARLEQMRRDRRRLASLHAQGVASRQRFEEVSAAEDELRAALERANSRLREARRRLAEATLVTPFAGTVTRVHLEPGEYAPAGAPVIAVSGADGLELEVEVPESVASSLLEGQEAQVMLPVVGIPTVAAHLVSVSRGAQGPGRLFPVVAELQPRSDLLPGMAGELVVRIRRGARLAVPLASVIDPGGAHPCVFRVAGEHAERVAVETHTLVGDHVTVTAPLQVGDPVVVAGHGVLLDGDRVEVR